MNKHQKLTPAQYRQIQEQNIHPYGTKMTPQDEAIHAGMATRHRPAHNFPVMTDKQVEFRLKVQDDMIADLMRRIARLEYAEMVRNLPSNKPKRKEID